MNDQERFEEWWEDYCKTHGYAKERDRCVAKIAFLAALAKERARCAGVCREMWDKHRNEKFPTSYREGYLDALDLAEQMIMEG